MTTTETKTGVNPAAAAYTHLHGTLMVVQNGFDGEVSHLDETYSRASCLVHFFHYIGKSEPNKTFDRD